MAGIFGFFDYTKPGKGVSKEDVNKKGIALYLINTIVFSLLIFSFLFYSYAQTTPVFYVLRAMIIVIAALFYMMHFCLQF